MPAQSHSTPSARSLPGIRITIVSRPHAPSIIAPWQGSGRHSVSGQHPRHVSVTALMEPPMSGLMEPLTGADLGSRTG